MKNIWLKGYQFSIAENDGIKTLIPEGNEAPLLSVIIGTVISPQVGITEWEKIKAGIERADGYVWYGPVNEDFLDDPDFVSFRNKYEITYGPIPPLDHIWGIKAEWESGTVFVPYTTLLEILELAISIRNGEFVDLKQFEVIDRD